VPDLSVDGTVELERLDNTHGGRPAFRRNEHVSLFRVASDGERDAFR
jgi:hypothetical protein